MRSYSFEIESRVFFFFILLFAKVSSDFIKELRGHYFNSAALQCNFVSKPFSQIDVILVTVDVNLLYRLSSLTWAAL